MDSRIAVKALQILCFLFAIFMYNILIFFLVEYHSGYHTTIKSPDKQNQGIAQKIINNKNMKFAMFSLLF